MQQNNRAPGKYRQMFDHIESQMAEGNKLVEIKADNPALCRKKLHAIALIKGVHWRFATLGNSVFIRATV